MQEYNWQKDYKKIMVRKMDDAWNCLNRLWYIVEYRIDIDMERYNDLLHQATFEVLHSRVYNDRANETFIDAQKSLERLWKMLNRSVVYDRWIINKQRERVVEGIKNIKELYAK